MMRHGAILFVVAVMAGCGAVSGHHPDAGASEPDGAWEPPDAALATDAPVQVVDAGEDAAPPDASPAPPDADTCAFEPWASACTFVNGCTQADDALGCPVCAMTTTTGSITFKAGACCEQACCQALGTCSPDGGTP